MMTPSFQFRIQKTILALTVLQIGMGMALLWAFWTGQVEKKGYPDSYILGAPGIRFNDFSDETLGSRLANPYSDVSEEYPPAAYVFFRAFSYSDRLSLIIIHFSCLIAFGYLLTRVLEPILPGPWARVCLAFVFLALSYPVLYCIDRGNLEIVVSTSVAWAVYFFCCRRDLAGVACLLPAICLKFYPAFLLVALLHRRKVGLAVLSGLYAVAITCLCACQFHVPFEVAIEGYRSNLKFYRDWYVLSNTCASASASPWITYKLALIGLQNLKIIEPVDFSFTGGVIVASYQVFSVLLSLGASTCAVYAWLYERKLTRSILVVLLYMSIAAPSGGDYRLIYAYIALILLMLLPDRRKRDRTVLILVALAVIPKKEILLPAFGITETGFADISIQPLLNPLLILAAIVILLENSGQSFDWPRVKKRLSDLLPWTWRRPRTRIEQA